MAGRLVPEDDRLTHADRADAAIVEVVQIGAADPARPDGDHDLPRTRDGRGLGLDPKVALAVQAADADGVGHHVARLPGVHLTTREGSQVEIAGM